MTYDKSVAIRLMLPDEFEQHDLEQHDDHVRRWLNSQFKPLIEENASGMVSKCLGMPPRPHAVASMSIFGAVHRVATKDGTMDFEVSDQSVWDAAIAKVLSKIDKLDLSATDPETKRPVEDRIYLLHLLRGIRIEHPFQNITDTRTAIIESAYNDSTVLVLGGEDGDLVLRNGRIILDNLQVGGTAVACIFPFGADRLDDASDDNTDGATDEPSATDEGGPRPVELSFWIIPDVRPAARQPAVLAAWIAMWSHWPNGKIPKLLTSGAPRTIEILTQEINKILPDIKNNIELLNKLQGGRIGPDSVKRALGLRAK